MSNLEEQIVYAIDHLRDGVVETLPDGMRALRWTARVPAPWAPSEIELLVLVPPAYPAQAPSGFDVRGVASPGDVAPAGAGARDVGGSAHLHFCWNPQTSIDYTSIDGIWRFAQFSERRFAQTP